MRMLQVASLCGLVATTSFVSASTLFPHVPLMIWSQRPVFAGSNTYLSSEMDAAAVASTMNLVLMRDVSTDSEGVLSARESSFQPAEVMCLFLLPSLVSEDMAQLSQGSDSFVQTAVQSSVSSVVIPHTTRTKPLLPELASFKPHIVDVENLDAFLVSDKGQTLFVNGRTDLLVVQLPEGMTLSDVDVAVKTAAARLNAASNGKTDFGFTGNNAAPVEFQDVLARRLVAVANATKNSTQAAILCGAGYLVGYSTAGKAYCFSHYVNITPDIMAGLLFGLLFVFMAYIGLSVLHQIQTPQRYPSRGAPRGKEF